MSLKKDQYDQIMIEYAGIRDRHRHELDQRRLRAYARVPELQELDRKTPSLAMNALRRRLSDAPSSDPAAPAQTQSFRDTAARITRRREQLLRENGFPPDYLELTWDCPDCHDTGYIGREKCHCLRKRETALLYDQSMTELAHTGSSDYISPTLGYVRAEEKIVSKGEIVTAEVAQILDSYKEEYNKVYGYGAPRVLLYIGNILLALALVVVLYFCIYYTNRGVFEDKNRYYYLLTVFVLVAVITFLLERVAPAGLYMMPYPVFALYLLAFFRKRLVLPVYMVYLLPLLIFCGNGMELFVMYLVAGTVTLETFGHLSTGWKQFVNAAIIFGVEIAVYVGFRLIDAGNLSLWWVSGIRIFVGAIATVALYPLIYLFERIFNLVSVTRLEEMADTHNPLLQELSAKAPGTFQHCLQVMNMVDAVGRATDADVALLRAAALYHDIGKMQNPLCFVENESSSPEAEKYHDGKSAKESAQDIIRHVDDGLAIATEHRLPDQIKAFIRSHHGTTSAAYFLNKYLNEGGDPKDTSAFYYHGQKPVTKEQVILMVCDSIEAASRTMKEFTPEACDRFVENIVAGKEKLGQFEDADITLHDLNLMKNMLKTYLLQIFHGRVSYPKRKR